MGLSSSISRIFTWWNGQTYGTMLWTWRKGQKVGEDAQGNVFYRNADDSRRWVIYNGYSEATKVAPEWHGWLHRTWDEPPTKVAVPRKAWEKPHLANLTGTADAYSPAGSLRQAKPKPRADYEAWTPE